MDDVERTVMRLKSVKADSAQPISRKWVIAVLCLTLTIMIAITHRPVRAYIKIDQGRRLMSEGNYAEALERFRAAREIQPSNQDAEVWMARACRKSGDLAGLRQCIANSEKQDLHHQKRIELERRLLLAETGRIGDVEMYLPELLMNAGADGAEICDAYSKGYCLNLKFSQAEELLAVWAAEFPRDYRPYLRRAQIYGGNKRWKAAIQELLEAEKRAPKEFAVLRELGNCLFKNGDVIEAERRLLQATAIRPTDTQLLMNLAQISFDRNDFQAAQRYLKEIVKIEPSHFPGRLLLAKACLGMNDAAGTIEIAEALTKEWPEDLGAHYVLAQALRTAGRMEEAKAHFKIHGELDKKWAQIESIGREMNMHPTDPRLRYELGVLLLHHVSRSEGVTYLESVFQFVPTHTGAHSELAEYYDKVGKPDLAALHRQQVNADVSAAQANRESIPTKTP